MTPDARKPIILSQDHAGMLDRFLTARAESSLVLISNARSGGLADHGRIFQGTYAAYAGKDGITGVAAHYWNGMVFLQAPQDAPALFCAAVRASGRPCTGIAGPFDQVQQVLPRLLEKNPRPAMNSRDILFSLDLDCLVLPDPPTEGDTVCRHPADAEIPFLVDLRVAYLREMAGPGPRASFEDESRDLVRSQQAEENLWVLEKAKTIVATTALGAQVSGMVQVGGVYTLPAHRCRGYGRAVVAGSLLEARTRGIRRAILFTGADMPAARAVYRALGFRPIGEYGLVIV
jgi:GNAT superfamily N-acetyltransferase